MFNLKITIMKTMKFKCLILWCGVHAFCVTTQAAISMRNEGQLYIGSNGANAAITIVESIKQVSNGSIVLNGKMNVGENVIHDASNHFFVVDALGKTTSTGTLAFWGNRGSARYITTTDIAIFDRGDYYMACPTIDVATNDRIFVSPKMGIDTKKVLKSGTGALVLQSGVVGGNVYNASLRLTDSGNSADVVASGSVVVELDVSLYRASENLFPFATPFKSTQMVGYFAGNWVRTPQIDGAYNHVTYPLANKLKSGSSSVIDPSQYLTYPTINMKPGSPYLIKPRPAGFDYSSLTANNGLTVVGSEPSLADKSTYVFDGKVYTLAPYNEQVFADDVLVNYTMNATPTTTVNWVFGNSYTAPISTEKLLEAMDNSALFFVKSLYVYPAGSTSYQPYSVATGSNPVQVMSLPEIPAMSVFMVRLSKNKVQNGTFQITKSMLTHGTQQHNSYAAPARKALSNVSTYDNQVILRVSPVSNDHIYDVAAIGLRADASLASDSYDMAKLTTNESTFQLYSLSAAGSKLSANGVPVDADKVGLCFNSTASETLFTLKASGFETLTSDNLLLEDIQTGKFIDLRVTPEYQFTSLANDMVQRFNVHFKYNNVVTPVEEIRNTPMTVYYQNTTIQLQNLINADMGAKLIVCDALGRIIETSKVSNYPSMDIVTPLLPGVYFLSLQGLRNVSTKFVVVK